MNKVSINNSWLVFLPVIGILIFVVLPQLQNIATNFNNEISKHQSNIQKLDHLKQLPSSNLNTRNEITRLEILVSTYDKVIEKKKFIYYKIGGALVIITLILIALFSSNYITKRKKTAPNNKKINFNYSNPYTDIIGQHISWDAVKESGSNFLSSYVKQTKFGYKIASSNYIKLIALGFILIGTNQVLWTFMETIHFTQKPIGIMKVGNIIFTSGGIFIGVGIFLLFKFTIKKTYIYQNKQIIKIEGNLFRFNQLHALQILQKFIQGNRTGGYYSYELNLVTKQGERYNLLNHGDKTYLLSDMVKLSHALNLPVWNNNIV